MNTAGRGRGWASTENKNSVLRRPGTVSPQTFDCTNLINRINQIEQEKNLAQFTSDIFGSVEKQNINNVMNKLHQQAVTDRKFAKKYAKLATSGAYIDSEDGRHTIRYYVIHALQEDYTRRIELREENVEKFRNSAYLLFEVCYYFMTYTEFSRTLFDEPLIDYLGMFLDSSSIEDLEIFAEQMTKYGGGIYEKSAASLDKVMNRVRKILITANLPASSRTVLLYILDIHAQKYALLPMEVRTFYAKELGDRSFIMWENKPEETERTEIYAVPRAIRGSGAGRPANQKSKKKLNSSAPLPKKSSDRKGWDHDDRFEKDYE